MLLLNIDSLKYTSWLLFNNVVVYDIVLLLFATLDNDVKGLIAINLIVYYIRLMYNKNNKNK